MKALKRSMWRIIQSATGKPKHQVATVQSTTMMPVIESLESLLILLEGVVKGFDSRCFCVGRKRREVRDKRKRRSTHISASAPRTNNSFHLPQSNLVRPLSVEKHSYNSYDPRLYAPFSSINGPQLKRAAQVSECPGQNTPRGPYACAAARFDAGSRKVFGC